MSEEAYILLVVKPKHFKEKYLAFRDMIEKQFEIVNEKREQGRDAKGQDIVTVTFGVKRR